LGSLARKLDESLNIAALFVFEEFKQEVHKDGLLVVLPKEGRNVHQEEEEEENLEIFLTRIISVFDSLSIAELLCEKESLQEPCPSGQVLL